VLSVVLCLFVLWSPVAHLFSALCCIVFVCFGGVVLLIFLVLSVVLCVFLWSRVAHLFSALCCIVFVFCGSCCSSF
jgi:hypothetical protein